MRYGPSSAWERHDDCGDEGAIAAAMVTGKRDFLSNDAITTSNG
jgi:hypothetical protein